MDSSVFIPALAANLTGQVITGVIFWYALRLQRDLAARGRERDADETMPAERPIF